MSEPICAGATGERHPNILHVLDVSTWHLTREEMLRLELGGSVGAFGYQGKFDEGVHTYLIEADDEVERQAQLADMGQGLRDVMEFALARGIGYVRFDRDADPLDGAHLNDW